MRYVPFVALALLVAVLGPWFSLRDVASLPEVDVRSIKRHVHGGRLLEAFPTGQGFRSERDGLRRIDVRCVPLVQPPTDRILLRLREGAADGPVVRSAEADPSGLRAFGSDLAFEFEPVMDSGGRRFFFELASTRPGPLSDCGAWLRYRGQVVDERPWGTRTLDATRFEGSFRARFPHLSGLAFAVERLDPRVEGARLSIWPDGQESPPPLAAQQSPPIPVSTGHATFTFESLPDSRFTTYRYLLELPPGSIAIGDDDGISFGSLYGGKAQARPDSPLEGASCDGTLLEDRDLIFRTWTTKSREQAAGTLDRRMGAMLWPATAAWIAAAVLFLLLLTRPGLFEERSARP